MNSKFLIATVYSVFIASVMMISSTAISRTNQAELIAELSPASQAAIKSGDVTLMPTMVVEARRPARKDIAVSALNVASVELDNALIQLRADQNARRSAMLAAIRTPFYSFGKSLTSSTER